MGGVGLCPTFGTKGTPLYISLLESIAPGRMGDDVVSSWLWAFLMIHLWLRRALLANLRSTIAWPQMVSELSTHAISADERTSCSTSDREADDATWQENRVNDVLMASNCKAHCILIDGIPDNRLGKKGL